MTICLNGAKKEVPRGLTLEELAVLYKLKKKSVLLELNSQVVEHNRFNQIQLQEDDTVEIVHFVGGG